MQTNIPVVLTIAGSDCSAGAGIQADLKTIAALGGYALTAITAVTAQNTEGVRSVNPVSAQCLHDQLDMLFGDFAIAVVKTGMLADARLVDVVVTVLRQYKPLLVVDPVILSSSGTPLLDTAGIQLLREQLLPLATVITPNRNEADRLGVTHDLRAHQAVLVTDGEGADGYCRDRLYYQGSVQEWCEPKLVTRNTHGTGCTLSAAIALALAQGAGIETAITQARQYTRQAITAAMHRQFGHGAGPLDHLQRGNA